MLQKNGVVKSCSAVQNVPIYLSSTLKRKYDQTKAVRDPGVKDGAGVKAELISGVVEE